MRVSYPVVSVFGGVFAALVAVAGSARAGQLHVPTGFPTIQAAIDAAAPGDVILVHGGTHDPFRVDRAVTIVANPQATIDNLLVSDPTQSMYDPMPNVVLAGPGSGEVVVANFRLTGVSVLSWFVRIAPRVEGGGFDRVILRDVVGDPLSWTSPTGDWDEAHGVDVTVPELVLVGCEFQGVSAGTDWTPVSPWNDAGAGVHAPSSTVWALDSTLVGGDAFPLYFVSEVKPCPTDLSVWGGSGDGLHAKTAFVAGSAIQPGKIEAIFCFTNGQPTSLGTTSSGVPIVADAVVPLGDALAAPLPLELGKPWPISWNTTPGAPALLVLGRPESPIFAPAYGWLFLDPTTLVIAAVAGGAQSIAPVAWNTPSLAGLVIGLQAVDPVSGLTRPVVGVALP